MISSHISKAAWLLTCLLVIYVQEGKTQNFQTLTPELLLPQLANLSPEASSLGRFGAYSVSEYSGSPNIRIPLFTIQSGDVSIPVELYYDASGIKVEQDATFVGLGWNLSYGGCISHVVCGGDDFYEWHWSNPSYLIDMYGNKSSTMPLYLDSYATAFRACPGGELCDPWPEDKYRLHDDLSRGCFVPDVFQASFCGQHVSFIIDKRNNDNVVILNNDPKKYKIEYEKGTTYPYHPSTIKITDDKGITYLFEPYREFDYTDTYYLKKVYGADGVSGKSAITFDYVSYNCNVSQSRLSSKTVHSIGKVPNGEYCPPGVQIDEYTLPNTHISNLLCGDNGSLNKIYPSKITTGTEIIEFSRQARNDLVGTYAISGIQVKSKNGTNLDKINFSYGYFEEDNSSSNTLGYTRKRLKLNSVTVNSKKYQMAYDTSTLPTFGSYSQDYWGYYNGVNNSTLCGTPKYVVENNTTKLVDCLGDANRYASENLCKVGMLKSIIYPTGGRTDFEFEVNRFNNEYFYPDANQGQTSTKVVTVNADGAYGSVVRSNSFSLQRETKCKFTVILNTTKSTNDVSTATIKTSTGSIIKTYTTSNGNTLSDTYNTTLAKGDYILEVSITANRNSYSTIANCQVVYEGVNIPTPNISLGEAKGGVSIGGGLRIKSIKNYDSPANNNIFLNGIEYEYRDGKLLTPTVRVEKHHALYTFEQPIYSSEPPIWDETCQCLRRKVNGYERRDVNFYFNYANSEPSYLYACSLDIPATVGYSKVIKKEVDENGNVIRKNILEFHNYGYQMDEMANQMVYNAAYYCDKGHLNGRVEKETLYSEDSKVQYVVDYFYNSTKLASIMYPKCVPTFFPNARLINIAYNLAIFRKNAMWCYLTSKNETFYDINGSKTTSKTTSFTYDSSNYQPSEQTVSDGLNTQKTKYWYPSTSGNKSAGLSNLTSKNCLSEVTAIDQYRNSKYTGGSRYDYTANNNLPVVSKCYSILPDNSTVLQMTVTGYDSYGNIREYQKMDGTPVTIIWSYNHQLPVMEIVGSTYANVKAKVSAVTSLESSSSVSYSTLKSVYTSLKTGLPDAYVTAYLYSPWHGVSCVIAPNGYETTYNYDNEGRLVEARDPQGILQKYQYNYKIK